MNIVKEEQFVQHANIRPREEVLKMGEKIATRDCTIEGCSPSHEVVRKIEPINVFGQKKQFVIECHYATGFYHKLCAEKPEWA